MYIDGELIEYVKNLYGDSIDCEKIVENCGHWYTLDGLRAEEEDFDLTLEDALADSYFVIENNNIYICPVHQIIDEIEDYILSYFFKRKNENKKRS